MSISYVPPRTGTPVGATPTITLHADGIFQEQQPNVFTDEMRANAHTFFTTNIIAQALEAQFPSINPTLPEALAHSNTSLSSGHAEEEPVTRRYRVRLERRFHGTEYYSEYEEAFVEVEAEDENEAGEIALQMDDDHDWDYVPDSRNYGDSDRIDTDDAEVENVEELT